jgi:hypothetical protein
MHELSQKQNVSIHDKDKDNQELQQAHNVFKL